MYSTYSAHGPCTIIARSAHSLRTVGEASSFKWLSCLYMDTRVTRVPGFQEQALPWKDLGILS